MEILFFQGIFEDLTKPVNHKKAKLKNLPLLSWFDCFKYSKTLFVFALA